MIKRAAAICSLVACLFLFTLYALRPDWAAAVTVFPAWGWLVLWLLALPAAWGKKAWRKGFLLTTLAWLLFAGFQIEEWRSMLRSVWPVETVAVEGRLRVTTINCSGSTEALADAFAEEPDILWVQESPGLEGMTQVMAERHGYSFLHGLDTSIVARGQVSEIAEELFYKAAEARVDTTTYFVVSLRLATSSPRIDLWNGDCWRSQTRLRKRQMDQMREVADVLSSELPLIVGGDFNVPQGDKVFSLLKGRAVDTFRSGGRGWCNTILDEFPVLRIDQIWVGGEPSCFDAGARRCVGTDHRRYTVLLR